MGRDESDKFVIASNFNEYLRLLISNLDKYDFYINRSGENAHFRSKVTTHALDFYDDIFRKKKIEI